VVGYCWHVDDSDSQFFSGYVDILCVSALRAGLEVEWAAVEKSLRKAVQKYVRNKSRDSEGDQEMSEEQIAEDESVERYNVIFFAIWLMS